MELGRRWLELLDPVLPAYRREPHLAQNVELIEYMANGGSDDAFTGSIHVAEHARNFS